MHRIFIAMRRKQFFAKLIFFDDHHMPVFGGLPPPKCSTTQTLLPKLGRTNWAIKTPFYGSVVIVKKHTKYSQTEAAASLACHSRLEVSERLLVRWLVMVVLGGVWQSFQSSYRPFHSATIAPELSLRSAAIINLPSYVRYIRNGSVAFVLQLSSMRKQPTRRMGGVVNWLTVGGPWCLQQNYFSTMDDKVCVYVHLHLLYNWIVPASGAQWTGRAIDIHNYRHHA